jgi:diguanylate cyclase (GGDEF)-like protein
MSPLRERFSVFAHSADRGTYIAYFLGAIVPLIALGIVVERFVLAPVGGPGGTGLIAALGSQEVLTLLSSVTMLSLGCFFMLRRIVNRSISENRTLAYHDVLTGLPNRRLFKDRLQLALASAARDRSLVAACFLDLDGFKNVNDSLGHSAGDRLLEMVAERLTRVLRLSDSIAREDGDPSQTALSRLGGDEFTILLTGIHEDQDAGRVARRILRELSSKFEIDGRDVFVTASIGIAVAPSDGNSVDELLRNADIAMYAAKQSGRNTFRFFSRDMNQATDRKLDLERRLRIALERDEFSLHYQPIRCSSTGRTTAIEALLRWNDAELGDVSPVEFIPVAEDAGLIVALGEWVIRTACSQARAWQDAGFRPVRMAVNVSGQQLRDPGFVDIVARTLEESGLSTESLELEITESTIMQDDEATNEAFQKLTDLGLAIALDDFGTGYSSLSYLRRFTIDRVKIDRSVVAGIPGDVDDMAVTAAIVAMAHNLMLRVVGEGVETPEQAQSLRELGCDELQGYLFSRAVRAEDVIPFLVEEKPAAD